MITSKAPQITCEGCNSRHNSIFGGLCALELSQVTAAKSCTRYKKGQALFHEGTRPLGVFCINEGKVKVYRRGGEGKEQITKISKSGDVLGYKAMISDEHYPVTAETLEDCTICFVPKTDFLQLLIGNEELYKRMMKAVCLEVGVMTENLTYLAQKSVRERLAIALLMLKDTYGIEGEEGEPVEINLMREDLANIVGTATETLIRLLHDFKEEKLITTKGRRINIEDTKGLVKAAGVL